MHSLAADITIARIALEAFWRPALAWSIGLWAVFVLLPKAIEDHRKQSMVEEGLEDYFDRTP